jgi:hypothetical protein
MAIDILSHPLARYYIGYILFGLVGGMVLAVATFFLFLCFCGWIGIADPAGNSGALLALMAFEICIMSVYGVLVVRVIRARISKVRHHLGSFRRLPNAGH